MLIIIIHIKTLRYSLKNTLKISFFLFVAVKNRRGQILKQTDYSYSGAQ